MKSLTISEKADIASTIKNVFQILFFIITSIIAVFSYLQAKKTLFNPIRTEIFKLQIAEFEQLLLFFQKKTEIDFSRGFDMNKILHVNATLMLDDFVETFFKGEIIIDIEKRKKMKEDFVGAVVSTEFAMEHFIKPEYHEKIKSPEKVEITNPALILRKWQNYKYGHIEFTKMFSDESENVRSFLSSPLLPDELKSKIINFEEVVHENLHLVGEVLSEIAQELPENFPNMKSIQNIEMSGIWNKYNKNAKSYEEPAKEILNFINQYLKIEKLIESRT